MVCSNCKKTILAWEGGAEYLKDLDRERKQESRNQDLEFIDEITDADNGCPSADEPDPEVDFEDAAWSHV